MKTVYLTLSHNAIKLFSIIDWYITDFIVVLPHTSTGPADHTATDIATPESITFTASWDSNEGSGVGGRQEKKAF
jgi:hypothetical protein